MNYEVTVKAAAPQQLAAVRRSVHIGEVGQVWRPALDLVWSVLRRHPGLRTDGHNVFLYHHPQQRDGVMDVDFGVQVTRLFEADGEVRFVETVGGEAVVVLHRGPYSKLRGAHDAVHEWCAVNQRLIAGKSWEMYGDWCEDEAKLETQIFYLLA